MPSACRAIAFYLFLTLGNAQTSSPTASQLEGLERFAGKPTANITWSKEITRIDTDQAHAAHRLS